MYDYFTLFVAHVSRGGVVAAEPPQQEDGEYHQGWPAEARVERVHGAIGVRADELLSETLGQYYDFGSYS